MDGHSALDGSSDGCSLGASQFQGRLHVLLQEWRLDSHLVGQIPLDDTRYTLEDMTQFQVSVAKLTQVDDTHCHHLRFVVYDLDDAISHDVRSRVYAQYHFFHYVGKGNAI